jgi:hypothetical protein
MMAYDQDKDGRLTKSEVDDERLQGLFDRADGNKDGTLTRQELADLAEKEASNPDGRFGFGPPPGPPPGGGFMFGPPPPPRPGEVLSRMFQERLRLTNDQKTQLEALQKEVDARLDKILNDEQRAELKAIRERGPRGFGPPGGRGPRRGGGPGPERAGRPADQSR